MRIDSPVGIDSFSSARGITRAWISSSNATAPLGTRCVEDSDIWREFLYLSVEEEEDDDDDGAFVVHMHFVSTLQLRRVWWAIFLRRIRRRSPSLTKEPFRVAIMCKSRETACPRTTTMDPLTRTDLVILHPSFISTPRSQSLALSVTLSRTTVFSLPLPFPRRCSTRFLPSVLSTANPSHESERNTSEKYGHSMIGRSDYFILTY